MVKMELPEQERGLQPRTKVLWVLIDGVGDISVRSLGRKTTLQVARTRACDAIAATGVSGMMDPVQAGHDLKSSTSLLERLILYHIGPLSLSSYYQRGIYDTPCRARQACCTNDMIMSV